MNGTRDGDGWLFRDRWGHWWRVSWGQRETSAADAFRELLEGPFDELWLEVHERVTGHHFEEPISDAVCERVRNDLLRAFDWQQLACEPADLRGAAPDRPHKSDKPPPPPDVKLVPYELVVVNEMDQPLADIMVRFVTPAGDQTLVTGADGAVRTEAPAGIASASLVALSHVRKALAGCENGPRRTAKIGEEVHVRALAQATDPIDVPSQKPKRLMILSRFDFYDVGHAPSWGDLSVEKEGPWVFQDANDDAGVSLLKAHADGTGAQVRVVREDDAWLEAHVDDIQRAIVRGDFENLLEFLKSLPVDRPPDDHTLPPPIEEAALFARHFAEAQLEEVKS